MTDEELDRLYALASAATPGKWTWWTSNSRKRLTGGDGRDGGVIDAVLISGQSPDVACLAENMAFIAAADPAMVMRMVMRIRELERSEDELMAERDAWQERVNAIADELGDETEWSNLNDRGANAIGLAAAHVREVARLREAIGDCNIANGSHFGQLDGGYLDREPAEKQRMPGATYRIRFGGAMLQPMRGIPSLDVAIMIASDFSRRGPFDDHAPWMTHLEPEERCNECRKRIGKDMDRG